VASVRRIDAARHFQTTEATQGQSSAVGIVRDSTYEADSSREFVDAEDEPRPSATFHECKKG
jgi:hypothetical protein